MHDDTEMDAQGEIAKNRAGLKNGGGKHAGGESPRPNRKSRHLKAQISQIRLIVAANESKIPRRFDL